ncbi:hypothetical protein LIER_31087 [Lithospermum erythrorhizon]|uniref:Uncharacterized protein n=1 Tax=Lithospermum erythrorhizon TaxID=34254 RepID=A0AAV3RTH3_LITER
MDKLNVKWRTKKEPLGTKVTWDRARSRLSTLSTSTGNLLALKLRESHHREVEGGGRVSPSNSVARESWESRVVEVSSSASELEHTELVDTGESPECFVTEVAESSVPTLPVLSLAQKRDISEISYELALLMMYSEDLTLKRHCEVKEAEAATLEARARDLRARAQERRSVVTQLDLEAAGISRQTHTLEEKIRVEQAKHLGSLSAELEAARLGLIRLL